MSASTVLNRGPTLSFATLMHTDIAQVVLRHLASTQERVRICRSISSECRQLVDSQVHSLRANLKSLSSHSHDSNGADAAKAAPSSVLPLRFPQLQRLSFDRSAASESSGLLLQLAEQQPQLLAHLQELDLSSCQGLEADALSALLQAAACLHSLTLPTLSPCVRSSKQDFVNVISTHGRQLQHLRGVGDYVDSDTLPLLGHLPALRSLDITTERHGLHIPPRSLHTALASSACSSHLHTLQLGNNLACYDTFELAAALPALRCLEFVYVCEVADIRVQQDLAPLRHSKTLRRLALSGVPCSDALLEVLAGTGVTDLSVAAAPFTATAKGAACMAGGQLQALQLGVNDTSSAALAAALPVLGSGLASLSLTMHRATADYSGLMRAAFGLPALQQLSLASHYNGLTESELQELPVAANLTSLSLSNHFSDATLSCVLRSAPALRELTLSSCGEVGSLGLQSVLGHCRGLRSVVLRLMRGVSAAGVAALASGPCVGRVVLEGCRNVSGDECRELMRVLKRPDLDIVKLK